MAKFAQYYLKYNLEYMFSAEYKDQRQQIFGAFFAQNDSMEFAIGEGEDKKVYKHQVFHLSQYKDIIVMRIANDTEESLLNFWLCTDDCVILQFKIIEER